MYILYGGDFTRAVLVQWVLEEGKLDYELRRLDLSKGEHRAPEFLAINPAGLVPVLITPEGDALYEVAALMVYLADRHQLTELAPAETDPQRGLVSLGGLPHRQRHPSRDEALSLSAPIFIENRR